MGGCQGDKRDQGHQGKATGVSILVSVFGSLGILGHFGALSIHILTKPKNSSYIHTSQPDSTVAAVFPIIDGGKKVNTPTVHPVFDPASIYTSQRTFKPADVLRASFLLLGFTVTETSAELAKHNKQYGRARGIHLKGIGDTEPVRLDAMETLERDHALNVRFRTVDMYQYCKLLLFTPQHLEHLKQCAPAGCPDPLGFALADERIATKWRGTHILASLPQMNVELQQRTAQIAIPFGDVVNGWPPQAQFVFLFS